MSCGEAIWWQWPGRSQRALKAPASGTQRAKASVVTGVEGCPLLQLKFTGSQVVPPIAATGRTRIATPLVIPHHSGSRNPKRRPGNYLDKSQGVVPRQFRIHIYRPVRMGFDPTRRPTGFQTGAQYRGEADGDAACCAPHDAHPSKTRTPQPNPTHSIWVVSEATCPLGSPV